MLVEEHSHPMFRLAYRMTGNEADAEDVVQETFMRAFRTLGRFDSRAQFSSWLHRIAANYAIDLLRRRKRWRSTDIDPLEVHAPLTAETPGPERVAWGSEVGRQIESALRELSRVRWRNTRKSSRFATRHFPSQTSSTFTN